MSKDSYKKITSLFQKTSMSNPNFKKNNYINIGSLTPRFVNIYQKYINSKKATIYPNIRSILNDFRAEKLNKLNEQEAMRGEIGQEIKKYKEIHELLRRRRPGIDNEKYFQNFTKKNKKKIKENKGIILDTFCRYENNSLLRKYKNRNKLNLNLNLLSPFKIFKRNKNYLEEKIKNKYNNKTEVYFNEKKMIDFFEKKIKEKSKTRDGRKLLIKNTWDQCHHKLNAVCDSITDDSIKIKINGIRTMERFNNTWNKYKQIQEFKFPETKKNIFIDN